MSGAFHTPPDAAKEDWVLVNGIWLPKRDNGLVIPR
jgi:hypothetical protein